jgi:xanthine dehydrogenase YagS FAD-binding subunit
MNSFEWADAATVDEAIGYLGKGAALKAGGVDLLDLMKERISQPSRLVNIRNVRALNFVRINGGALELGPLVTLAAISEDPQIRKSFAALADAAGHAATPQIRNMATVGGNILQRPRCWYFRNEDFHCRKKGGEICYAQDGENQYHAIFNNKLCAIVHPSAAACALVAMGAKLQLSGAKDRREVSVEEFLTLPAVDVHRENSIAADELITQITVPALPAGATSAYIKQGEKESFDWPIAECAVVLERDGQNCRRASIVLGAAAPVPHRALEAENSLAGKLINDASAKAAARAALATASPMSQNAYKIAIFEAIIARTILAAATLGGAN